MPDVCMLVHKRLDTLPMFKFPFPDDLLPDNGIYFFYEQGEYWGHGGTMERIVHVGAHRGGKLADDILRHFVEEKPGMHLTKNFYSAMMNSKERTEKIPKSGRSLLNTIRKKFSFRFVVFDSAVGSRKIEDHLATALSECLYCSPSRDWIGNNSSNPKIRDSGIWKVPKEPKSMTKREIELFNSSIEKTYKWLKKKGITAPVLKY